MMKGIVVPGLRRQALAIVIWATAVLAGVLVVIPNDSTAVRTERWLATFAGIALAYVGYVVYRDTEKRVPSRWQSAVWLGTFLLVAYFVVRAILRQGT
jgi:uncharacterized membrane protein HdeD (DUF308 family)